MKMAEPCLICHGDRVLDLAMLGALDLCGSEQDNQLRGGLPVRAAHVISALRYREPYRVASAEVWKAQ
jgi:hypothetical protein